MGIVIGCCDKYDGGGLRSSPSYIFSFYYGGHNYKSSHGKGGGEGHSLFMNSCFPIAINKENPEENAVLIFPSDFERYNLNFPDSLNWVLKYQP